MRFAFALLAETQSESGSLYLFIFPVCLALIGLTLTVNFRGVADALYFRIERIMTVLAGGIGPRAIRIAGVIAFVFGSIGAVVEGRVLFG